MYISFSDYYFIIFYFLFSKGDGNFSFTLSLVKRLVSYGINTNIVATSYDSYEELCRKYPEFLNIKNKLNSYEQVRIVHNINATTLQQYNILESYCYNEIIFNFPHLSKEDCNAHYSLLCHTMYRYSYCYHDLFC